MTSQQKHKRNVLLEGWRRFVVSSFVVRQLLANSNKNGTEIYHKWDQSGPGVGGKRYAKINENMKTKKQIVKNQNE